jgi:hypothetical protein
MASSSSSAGTLRAQADFVEQTMLSVAEGELSPDEEAGDATAPILPEDIDRFLDAELINAATGGSITVAIEVGEHGLSLRSIEGILLKVVPIEHMVQYGKKADADGDLYLSIHISEELEEFSRMLLRTDDAVAVVSSINRFAEKRAEAVIEEAIQEEERASQRRSTFSLGRSTSVSNGPPGGGGLGGRERARSSFSLNWLGLGRQASSSTAIDTYKMASIATSSASAAPSSASNLGPVEEASEGAS